jgi:hypothetical protein
MFASVGEKEAKQLSHERGCRTAISTERSGAIAKAIERQRVEMEIARPAGREA